jgi:hypothetical protein
MLLSASGQAYTGDLLFGMSFDNGLADMSSHSNTISPSPAYPIYVDGLMGGKAAYFNGASAIRVAGAFDNTPQLALSFWIKPSRALELCDTGLHNGGNGGVISKGSALNNWSWQIRYGMTTKCYLGMQLNTVAGARTITLGQNLLPNTWYHVLATYDGTTAAIYLDGTLKESMVISSPLKASASDLYIGEDGWTNYLDATLDTVTVWNGAISYQELLAMASATTTTVYSTLPTTTFYSATTTQYSTTTLPMTTTTIPNTTSTDSINPFIIGITIVGILVAAYIMMPKKKKGGKNQNEKK